MSEFNRDMDELAARMASGDIDPKDVLARRDLDPTVRRLAQGLLDDAAALSTLPLPTAPSDHYANIMDALPKQPRTWTWRGMAVAAALSFVASAALTSQFVSSPEPDAAARSAAPAPAATLDAASVDVNPAPTVAPSSKAAGLAPVRFVYVGKPGQTVQVVGGFNGWGEKSTALEATSLPGIYQATVSLPSGEHEYMFVIDGDRFEPDPLAERSRSDAFGRENSVLMI